MYEEIAVLIFCHICRHSAGRPIAHHDIDSCESKMTTIVPATAVIITHTSSGCMFPVVFNSSLYSWFSRFLVLVSLRHYGVVPKRLLTFLGSLYKEVAKTTSKTLMYRFERQTARKNSSFEKHSVLDLECRILSQEPSGSCILWFKVTFLGK